MKLQIVEEPQLAFHQGKLHVDIRAGLSTFGAFDKGSTGVPVPIRIGVIGTTATSRQRARLAGALQARCCLGRTEAESPPSAFSWHDTTSIWNFP